MKFKDIFNEDGLYVADGFDEGAAFKISEGTLYLTIHKDKDDLFPYLDVYPVHKSLFEKEYRKVLTRQSLFSK